MLVMICLYMERRLRVRLMGNFVSILYESDFDCHKCYSVVFCVWKMFG